MYMIMLVLDDADYLDEIFDAWLKVEISGATIVESTGLYRRQLSQIPMRYTYAEPSSDTEGNMTIFVIVESEAKVELCLKTVEEIVGDLNKPNPGVFSAWPLPITKGFPAKSKN